MAVPVTEVSPADSDPPSLESIGELSAESGPEEPPLLPADLVASLFTPRTPPLPSTPTSTPITSSSSSGSSSPLLLDDDTESDLDLLCIPVVVEACEDFYRHAGGFYGQSRRLGPRDTELYMGDIVRRFLGNKLSALHGELRGLWLSKDVLFADNAMEMARFACHLMELEALMQEPLLDDLWKAVDTLDDIGYTLKCIGKLLKGAYKVYVEHKREREAWAIEQIGR